MLQIVTNPDLDKQWSQNLRKEKVRKKNRRNPGSEFLCPTYILNMIVKILFETSLSLWKPRGEGIVIRKVFH